MKKIIEKILLKIGFIKIKQARHISEMFVNYMVEDIQKLVQEDFGRKPHPTYHKEMIKALNKTFDAGITGEKLSYKIKKDRGLIVYGENR